MKIGKLAALLLVCWPVAVAIAQSGTPPAPSAPQEPPSPPEPVAAPRPKLVDGVLMKSQRASSDRGKYEWVCTYRVAGTTRSVLLDESCPQTVPFELKR